MTDDTDVLNALEFTVDRPCDIKHTKYARAAHMMRWECDTCGNRFVMALCDRCYQWTTAGRLTCPECHQAESPAQSIKEHLTI